MATIYAGTSGWAYSSWKPGFYPAKLASTKFLEYYSGRLNTVEVNYTFQHFPTKTLLQDWVAATPTEFKFAVKAHQIITHMKRLRGARRLTGRFISSLEPLLKAKKLGPILFQLPPFLKCDLTLLKDFLAGLPRETRAAFEFRNTSWFTDEVYALLHRANVALCLAESEKIETPHVHTADFSYLRLRNDAYPARIRKELTRRIRSLVRRGDVFVYFKHNDTPEGALYAEALLAGCKRVQGLAPHPSFFRQ
ncbi:MAG: DUF72 domain-containing protein [Candidatus Acidiferrales bacterium]